MNGQTAAALTAPAHPDEAALWMRRSAGADARAREQLILRYVPLVHSVVGRLGLRCASEYDDLIGHGLIGLIRAVDRFDPARGVGFSTFATWHIEGRVRDGLRSLDPLSRTARRRVRQVEAAADSLFSRLGRAPADSDVAALTGLAAGAVRRARRDAGGAVLSLDAAASGAGLDLHETLADDAEDPLAAMIDREAGRRLREVLSGLPEREQQILGLHYREGLTLREIARRLNLSQARVCQLHARAVKALRAQVLQDEQPARVN